MNCTQLNKSRILSNERSSFNEERLDNKSKYESLESKTVIKNRKIYNIE